MNKALDNSSYLSNPNLKPANVKIPFTKEHTTEWIRCYNDPIYFIKNYYRIVHVDRGLINFEPYEYQLRMANNTINRRHVIAKWPRQSGKTTVMAALLLWYVLFNKNFTVAILAHKFDQAQEILSRIKYAYEFIPKWMQQGIVEWNKRSIELENNSKIFADATTASSIRGRSINILYLDEFAFVEKNVAEKFFSSVYPTISSGKTTKLIITSTPQGLNYFYRLWKNSELGRNDYHRLEINWWDTPGRDEKWKEETLRALNGDERKFEEEYGCSFLGSSKTLISAKVLEKMVPDAPIKTNEQGVRIYFEPIPGHSYIITVDTSRGLQGDYSAFTVFDVTNYPFKIAALYRNNEIMPLVFPNIIHTFGSYYNNAYILVERNDIGEQVANILQLDLENEYLLYTTSRGRRGQQITFDMVSKSTLPGVMTSKTTKKIGCVSLKTLVESNKLLVNDFDLIEELSRFSENDKGSWEAEDGHDDLVMTCVLFAWLSTQAFMQNIQDLSVRKVLENEKRQEFQEQMAPVGVVNYHDSDIFDEVVDLTLPDNYQDFDEFLRS